MREKIKKYFLQFIYPGLYALVLSVALYSTINLAGSFVTLEKITSHHDWDKYVRLIYVILVVYIFTWCYLISSKKLTKKE